MPMDMKLSESTSNELLIYIFKEFINAVVHFFNDDVQTRRISVCFTSFYTLLNSSQGKLWKRMPTILILIEKSYFKHSKVNWIMRTMRNNLLQRQIKNLILTKEFWTLESSYFINVGLLLSNTIHRVFSSSIVCSSYVAYIW